MEAVWFMVFSTGETFAIHALIMSLLRTKITHHLGIALLIMTLANIQSFIMRSELHLDNLAPLITVLIFIFLYSAIMKVPVIWSAICTIIGYMLYAILQIIYLAMIFGAIDTVQRQGVEGYILQILSAGTGLLIAWLLFKLRIGIRFNPDRMRLKYEYALVITLIAIVLVLLALLFYLNHLWLHLVFFGTTFGIFLYYAILSEERNDHDYRKNR